MRFYTRKRARRSLFDTMTRVMSPYQTLADGDPVSDWFERCLDLHGGLGRSVPAAA